MLQQLPAFDDVALANGYQGDLYVLGLVSHSLEPGRSLYLAASQASNTGAWLIPSYNALGFAPRADSLVVGNGNGGNLQLLGLSRQRICLLAWQDNADGTWHAYGENPLDPPGSSWRALAVGRGFQDQLFLVALGTDGRLYRGPSQNRSGAWERSVTRIGNAQREWQQLAVGRGNGGNLQVFGLSDGHVYLAAWQANHDGSWHEADICLCQAGHVESVVVANGYRDELNVFGLVRGSDGATRPRLLAWQSSDNGEWHIEMTDLLHFAPPVTSLATARGNAGNLQLVGLRDQQLQLAAWQDQATGAWHGYAQNPLGSPTSRWRSFALGYGAHGDIEVISLGLDHSLYVAARQTHRDGAWHAGPASRLTRGDGRWNQTRLKDVPRAFANIPARYSDRPQYSLDKWDTWEPFPITSHYQGMARYHGCYVLPFSAPKVLPLGVESKLVALDIATRRELRRTHLPEPSRPHPGGCQVVGDFLAVELESYQDEPSILRFYWLGSLDAGRDPTLLPAAITLSKDLQGVTAVAITDVGEGDNRHYLLALRSGRGGQELTCFEIHGMGLDDPNLKLGSPIYIDTSFEVPGVGKHGPDSLNLLTDANGDVYLVAMGGDANLPLELNFRDWADLWRLDLQQRKLHLVESKHVYTSAGPKLATGVHLRFGAGTWVESPTRLELYASGPQGQLPHHGNRPLLDSNEFVPR